MFHKCVTNKKRGKLFNVELCFNVELFNVGLAGVVHLAFWLHQFVAPAPVLSLSSSFAPACPLSRVFAYSLTARLSRVYCSLWFSASVQKLHLGCFVKR